MSNLAPILTGGQTGHRTPDQVEIEEQSKLMPEPMTRGTEVHYNSIPVSRLDISVFEGDKLRWWLRRCKRVFLSIPSGKGAEGKRSSGIPQRHRRYMVPGMEQGKNDPKLDEVCRGFM